MKYYTLPIILLISVLNTVHADQSEQIKKYKQNYAEQLIPLLKEQMSTETEMESEADANEHIATIAERMANCQLLAIEGYPQKYQNATIEPIANGAEIKKTASDVNTMIQTDIENGDFSKQDFLDITEAATEKYKVCISYPE
ncbi:MAG: hypothetical protein ACRBDX_11490 [Gammaproteobacteria bacterium]